MILVVLVLQSSMDKSQDEMFHNKGLLRLLEHPVTFVPKSDLAPTTTSAKIQLYAFQFKRSLINLGSDVLCLSHSHTHALSLSHSLSFGNTMFLCHTISLSICALQNYHSLCLCLYLYCSLTPSLYGKQFSFALSCFYFRLLSFVTCTY